VDVARKSMFITTYTTIYYIVIMLRGAALYSGDNILFFIFFVSVCEFAGTCARRAGTLLAVQLRDRRFSLRPDVPIRQQRVRRGRPQVWKEIVKP
jgi:hypothetical protein